MDRHESASSGFAHEGYRFGGFRLEADGTLLRGENPIRLQTKELAALRLLLANPGRLITPLEMKQALWGDEPVAAESVSRCLAALRKKLEPEECIHAVYKRGYRLSVEVLPLAGDQTELPRLAILPFTAEQGVAEHLGPSVAEETGSQIGQLRPGIAAILAKDSVFALARRGLAPQRIGQMMGADLVLSGSLRALPAHYRMRAEMIQVRDGSQAWVEDRIVERSRRAALETELVDLVNLRMSTGGLSISASAASASVPELPPVLLAQQREAYEAFQHARYEWKTLERHRMQDALQRLLRSIELDPGLAAARIELAHLCVAQSIYGHMPPWVAADHVRRAAQPVTVSVPDENLLPALGWISFHVDRNLPAALWQFAQSAHLPYDPWIVRSRVLFTLSRHRFAEAIQQVQAALRVDPYLGWLQGRLAWAHHLAGDAAASVQLARAALDRLPESEPVRIYATLILAFNGETAQALALARALSQQMPHFDLATMAHAYALAAAGEMDAARALLERFEWLSRERYAIRTFLPAIYLALGDEDRAIAELRTAEQSRCPWFFQMLADPRLRPLHGHPEFQSMFGILAGMEAEAERDKLE